MRNLLATTALAALMAGPMVVAANHASAAGASVGVTNVTTIDNASATGYLASNLMGKTVYTSAAADAQAIGNVNDVVIGEDGSVRAVIVGAGGFIGIGEKEVAIDFKRLTMQKTGDGVRLVSALTKQELEVAPTYDGKSASASLGAQAGAGAAAVGSAISSTTKDLTDKATDLVNGKKPADRAAFLADKTKVAVGSISAEQMAGAKVYDRSWNEVGVVGETVAAADGRLDAAIVDVGGFLGLGAKPVAIGLDRLDVYQDTSGKLYVATPYTQQQLEAAIAYDASVYETKRDVMRLTPGG
ncbi:PRC-barrel domain-containing protein [Thalassobaculum sp.]|uniref:PRC-barrel domain-containing protein n=1 Tax=Thalassobaculum sp. TaxID=2022740 RepID=UPI0032ECD6A2